MLGKKMMRDCLLLSISLLLSSADARIWTSTSGATVEADFVENQMGYVVLERADGGRLKIMKQYLSQDDKDYIAGLTDADKNAEPQMSDEEIAALFGADKSKPKPTAPVQDSRGQDSQQPQGAQAEAVLAVENIQSAVNPAIDKFKFLRFTPDENSFFMGLQYGAHSNDVLCIAFERESEDAAPSTAYVRDLSSHRLGRKTFTVNGRRGTRELDGMEFKVVSFKGIAGESTFQKHTIKCDIELIYGLGGVDQFHILAYVEVEDLSREVRDFHLFGSVPHSATLTGKTITPQSLFGDPAMTLRVAYKRVYGMVKVAGFELIPGRRGRRDIMIAIKNPEGELLKEYAADADDDIFFAKRSRGWPLWCDPKELEKSGEYLIEAKLDMSPILAPVGAKENYKVN